MVLYIRFMNIIIMMFGSDFAVHDINVPKVCSTANLFCFKYYGYGDC